MNRHVGFKYGVLVVMVALVAQGCAMATIKQLSRNNLNDETIAQIIRCVSTKDEIVALFRAPTDDFMEKQGEYDIYIYKGFAGNLELAEQKLEVMLNDDDFVVDYRLNDQSGAPMQDTCL